ncbi:hypothetical protein Rhal01_00864 [Rubritalea halochordaticola]|uniref:Hydrolase n=1 Tax=Rubritalea halochordaticola TaxID=714537 RepID=A0ABP9UWC0_9BACT
MKVVFLDIDGVLVNGRQITPSFDHEAVKRLYHLVTSHEAKVVLSSDWRHTWAPERLSKEIHYQTGVEIRIDDATPTKVKDEETGLYLADIRGAEIQAWLDDNEVSAYVILDDMEPSNFLQHQLGKHVWTNFHTGFTQEKLQEADGVLCG